MTDDSIREVHGVRCALADTGYEPRILISEKGDDLVLAQLGSTKANLTEWQARYLAAKLYRLSRRIRERRQGSEPDNSICSIACEVSRG